MLRHLNSHYSYTKETYNAMIISSFCKNDVLVSFLRWLPSNIKLSRRLTLITYAHQSWNKHYDLNFDVIRALCDLSIHTTIVLSS